MRMPAPPVSRYSPTRRSSRVTIVISSTRAQPREYRSFARTSSSTRTRSSKRATLGADCILLIVAALEPGLLQDCYACAAELGLDALIEVHDKSELETALELSPMLIGINNRDLRTFDTKLSTTYDLLPEIPNDVIVVTESGIHERSRKSPSCARTV